MTCSSSSSSIMANFSPSVEIKVEAESVDSELHFKIENEEMERKQSDMDNGEDPLSMKSTFERIGRKLLAGGREYCSICYDIFENSQDLSAHFTRGCPGYMELDQSVNGIPTSSSSSSSLAAVSNSNALTVFLPFSTSNDNGNNNNYYLLDDSNNPCFTCPFCPFTAPWSLYKAEVHLKDHALRIDRRFSCSLCPTPRTLEEKKTLTFPLLQNWLRHVKIHAIQKKRLGSRFSTNFNPISYHQHPKRPKTKTKTRTKKSKLPETKQVFKRLSKYQIKKSRNSASTLPLDLNLEKSLSCPFCPVSAPSMSKGRAPLDKHIRTHMTGKYGEYTCALCPVSSDPSEAEAPGLIFWTAHDWFTHVRTEHGHSKSKPDRDLYSINRMRNTAEEHGKKYKRKQVSFPLPPPKKKEKVVVFCSFPNCLKVFSSTWSLNQHVRVHEGVIVEYSCTYPGCPDAGTKKNWGDLEEFQLHVNSRHRKQGSFGKVSFCTVPDCFKKLVGGRTYVNHVLSHKKKPFTCSTCQMKFYSASNLKSHEERHQSGNGTVEAAAEEEEEEDLMNDQKPEDSFLCEHDSIP